MSHIKCRMDMCIYLWYCPVPTPSFEQGCGREGVEGCVLGEGVKGCVQ